MLSVNIKDLSYSIKNKKVLNKINLELEKDKIACILGPSGCGKTTLLKLIAGLSHVQDGEIFLNDNLVSSNILAVVPTGKVDGTNFNNSFLYSNLDYDNGYVVMGNPFKGQLNIQLTDQDGTLLDNGLTNNKSYNIKIEIYFPQDDQFIFNNNKNLLN